MSEQEKRIFVPTDFSKPSVAALHYATYIANRLNAGIDLVHIAGREELLGKKEPKTGYKEKLKSLGRKLNKMKNESGAAFRIHEQIITTDESIFHKIIETGEKLNAELACIGTYGSDSKPSGFKLGNNTEKLVRAVTFPVLTCRENKIPVQFGNFLLPIDLSKHTGEKVDRIVRFAKSFDAVIHLVAVSELMEEITSNRAELGERLEEAAEIIRKNGLKCTTEMIRHDSVANSVLIYAEEIHADLLVIMSTQENIFNQFLWGSRINKVVSHAEIPVLSFRPAKN